MISGNTQKYVLALLITAGIFVTALAISNHLNEKRIENIKRIENEISTDILSLETQFDLLEEASCEAVKENPMLSQELNSISRRLSYTEDKLGTDNPEVLRLKRTYSLLQIKDYLLMQKVDQKCGESPISVLYFYSNKGDCPECSRAGHVLTYLREQYPSLRVYAFDYHLDLSALQTLISIKDIEGELPAFVIDGEIHYGFQSKEDMETMLPVERLRKQEETATTSEAKDAGNVEE